MVQVSSLSERGIYHDLLHYFVTKGHQVYIVFPYERRQGIDTKMYDLDGAHFLGVRTLNLTKANVIEKGIGQVCVEGQFKRAIRKFWGNVHFDHILYSTPPITLMGVVKYLKDCNPQAKSYLLLKDIFPQNAVDIGLMSTSGPKGLLYRFFRRKEKALYRISDHIGCMSPANVEFVLKHNPEISRDRVEVAPNSLELNKKDRVDNTKDVRERKEEVRNKYSIPMDKPVFIYGGNLGKPQGIGFLVKCLDANKNRTDCHFVVVGSGTDQHLIQTWYDEENPQNMTLLHALPKSDYDVLVQTCDVGLIFLDHRFTIPNFPSRLLSYLENRMPVICATDPNCDMGPISETSGFGYWCESNSVDAFSICIDKMLDSDIKEKGENAYNYLCENYLVDNTYNAIMKH